MNPPLDAELGDHLLEAEAGRNDANGADDRTGIDDDLVTGESDEIAAGGGNILDGNDDAFVRFLGKRPDALKDEMRLDGSTAR
jgi:hypothetical protein